jgi:alginate O-acetyltransferase complex protein AlgI
LGGARGTNFQVYRNLFITFFLIGLWHGASWNFALYGTGHALAMILARYLRKRRERLGKPVQPEGSESMWGIVWRVFVTFHFVVLMRILFRSATQHGETLSSADALASAGAVADKLFLGAQWAHVSVLTPWLTFLLVGSYVVHWTPRRWVEATWVGYRKLPFAVQGAIMILIVLLATALADGKPPAFEYFNF